MPAAATASDQPSDLVPGAMPASDQGEEGQVNARPPTAAVALRLAQAVAHRGKGQGKGQNKGGPTSVIFVAADERRADEIGRALPVFAPDLDVLVLPPWDCLPYDRASPSAACMGRRAAVLQRLATDTATIEQRRVLVTSPEALVQRVGTVEPAFALRRGEALDRGALEHFAHQTGYAADERVDEPGEIAVQGHVIDIFPADAAAPVRLDLSEDGRIDDMRWFDVASQRTGERIETLDLVPASELALPAETQRAAGIEHKLPAYQDNLRTLFDLLPRAAIAAEGDAAAAGARVLERVADAYDGRQSFASPEDATPSPPDHLYLGRDELRSALEQGTHLDLELDTVEPVPNFALERDSLRAVAAFVREATEAGGRVVVSGLAVERAPLARALKRGKIAARDAADWHSVTAAKSGSVFLLEADLERGFVDGDAKLTLVTASDVFGARVATASSTHAALTTNAAPHPNDVVVHEDHGVALVRGLEQVDVDGATHEVLRLDFHGDAKLLVPIEELDRIWRYGSAPDAVTLDRLEGDGWNKRRVKVNAAVEEAAARLLELAAERDKAKVEKIEPPADTLARFAARFPFPETADQSSAIAAVLEDLASGKPMNRLVCGDVGFGKTEVALRAAAAVALSGRQVAVVAPTTVLARQHAQTFERRFAGTGIAVVQLSRLIDSADAKAAKQRLASGDAGVVIGTQMIASSDVEFADLALVIVDEEHRFGTKTKEALRALAPHHLALSATPIPRTLQGALVGVQDISILAAPPARRRPVRTFLAPYDKAAVRTALNREKRRGGQSFVVVPRVEDIEATVAMLKEIAPALSVEVVHGKLDPEAVDEAMVRFADGGRDVLVATTLIENGLDVPRANTIVLWGADRFGLAQLHQLRGRVGRGRVQGIAYLFAPEEEHLAGRTAERLATLIAADRLGAGFDLSSHDLDLRGGGDLVGAEQAGHMKLIGASLYQHLLGRAVRKGKGERLIERRPPALQIGGDALIPDSYVPDEAMRIELYARLVRLEDKTEVDALHDEFEDRFGALPAETERLFARRRVAIRALQADVSAIVVGPKAAALTIRHSAIAALKKKLKARWKDDRLLLDVKTNDVDINLKSLEKLLTRFVGAPQAKPKAGAGGTVKR